MVESKPREKEPEGESLENYYRDIAGANVKLRNLAFDHDRQEPKNLFEEFISKEARFIAFATSDPYLLIKGSSAK